MNADYTSSLGLQFESFKRLIPMLLSDIRTPWAMICLSRNAFGPVTKYCTTEIIYIPPVPTYQFVFT